MYEASYWGLVSAYTIIHVQAGFIHVICLGISVAVPRQCPDRTAEPCRALQHMCDGPI